MPLSEDITVKWKVGMLCLKLFLVWRKSVEFLGLYMCQATGTKQDKTITQKSDIQLQKISKKLYVKQFAVMMI